MLVLTLESSCDETAAAVVRDGRQVLSNVVASQIDVHNRYGGVVPEIAARQHVSAIGVVVDAALEQAGIGFDALEGIGVTRGPGLIGALLVGLSYARGVAHACKLPLVGLHHIEGHILAPLLEYQVSFPYLALAVSGGHTHLYRVEGIGRYRTVGRTRDDAAGEAFDKVAKLLGLGYPGGARIDQLAALGNPAAITFPRPMLHTGLDFSFSGIKTSVRNHLEPLQQPLSDTDLSDLAASFQAAMVEVLCKKTLRAAEAEGLQRIVVCGGVACNRGLRAAMTEQASRCARQVFFPSPALCGDNAAMLGVAADAYLVQGAGLYPVADAIATWPLDHAAPANFQAEA
jgi:N6-L-threonylcarbamoyladenine synthase